MLSAGCLRIKPQCTACCVMKRISRATRLACSAGKSRTNYVRAPLLPDSSPQGEQHGRLKSNKAVISPSRASNQEQVPFRSSRPETVTTNSRKDDSTEWVTPRLPNYAKANNIVSHVTNKDEGDLLTAEIRRGMAPPAVILRSYKTVKSKFQTFFGTDVPTQVFRGLASCNYSTDHVDATLTWLVQTYTPRSALRILKRAHLLLSISFQDMQQRVHNLATLLGTSQRATEAILKEPRILTLDVATASHHFACLQALLERINEAAYMHTPSTAADVALRSPRVLTVFPETLAAKWDSLHPLLQLQPTWQRDFEKLGPYMLGEALLKGNECFARLVFLAEMELGGVRAWQGEGKPPGLRAALLDMSQAQFMQRCPGYKDWLMHKVQGGA